MHCIADGQASFLFSKGMKRPSLEGERGERLSPLDGKQSVYKLDAEYLHWVGNDYSGKQEADIQAGRINNLFRKLPRSAKADYAQFAIM